MIVSAVVICLCLSQPVSLSAQESSVYRTVLLRAAPGRLLELIDRLNVAVAGEERPLILRHSQGDQWDLMVLQPVSSLGEWFAPARVARRLDTERGLDSLVAWREEEFVAGPALAALRARDQGTGFYHIEMFVALAGKRDELVRQRQMENAYLAGIGRRENLIFTRLAGSAWDCFTIGFYRDIRQYAEDVPMSVASQDSVARAVGFAGRSRIGTYLRELIASHHDTLAGRVHP